ncbi:hypothetical protein, partial [Sphingobium sp.]|uniref:hypothetical protein n=1 Tax=Sphingobium sp. TaxID=1912891 RepID=UPI003BB61858
FDPVPLVIPKRVAIHRRSPKISLESDFSEIGNPKSLNHHYALAGSAAHSRISGEARENTPPRHTRRPHAGREADSHAPTIVTAKDQTR